MIELVEELSAASSSLETALERYRNACSAIHNSDSSIPRTLKRKIADEVLLADSHEKKIRKSRLDLAKVVNRSHDDILVNALPSETLSRIFQLVLDSDLCFGMTASPGRVYPDALSHVCSYWRQVALESRQVWSHIDLAFFTRPHLVIRGLDRATTFAARAGQSPLNVHIFDPYIRNRPHELLETCKTFVPFLTSIAPRMRSLKMTTRRAFTSFYRPMLQTCFANAIIGVLKEVIITEILPTANSIRWGGFVEADGSSDTGGIPLGLPLATLEDLLAPLNVLHLSGLYIPWTSRAYEGLTELHLVTWRTPPFTITESQLIKILSSNPLLTVFDFNLRITNADQNIQPILPVNLVNLEALNLTLLGYCDLRRLLQWIAPGKKPLRLSMSLLCNPESLSSYTLHPDIGKFVSRINVKALYIHGKGMMQWAPAFLRLLPSVKVLVLNSGGLDKTPPHDFQIGEQSPSHGSRRLPLDRLTLVLQVIDIAQLKTFVSRYPAHTLVLHGATVFKGEQVISDEQELHRCLARMCPAICSLPPPSLVTVRDFEMVLSE